MSNISEKAQTETNGLPQAAAVLAYAGALPPIIAALLVWMRADTVAFITPLMLTYGGVLIAFFGGVRWGVAVMRPEGPSFTSLLGGVAPLVMAAPLFLLDDLFTRFLITIVVLPILLWDDLRATRRGSGAPDWYLGVRTPLTILMSTSYLLAFLKVVIS